MRLFQTALFLVLCVVYSGSIVASQNTQTPKATPLTNIDIVDMLKAGLSQEIVVAKIHGSTSEFDTTPGALKELKAADVPEAVILAMLEAANRKHDTSAVTPEGHPTSEPTRSPASTENQTIENKRAEAQKAEDDFSDCKTSSQNEYDKKMNALGTMALSPMMRVYAANKLKQNLDAELRGCRSQYESRLKAIQAE